MSSYPVLVKSSRYESVQYLKPQLPEKPKEPELKLVKKNWFEKLILWCDDYDDECINNQRKERYAIQMEEYRRKLSDYHRKVNEILSETQLNIFRKAEREKAIQAYDSGSPLAHDVRKGRHEEEFYSRLRSRFGDKITNSIEFVLPNGNAFVPDAAYVDKQSGLCIDIEIDEPYTIPERIPIHCIGEDDYRNSYFSARGWFVIRFAEEQVARYPDACISYINSFINGILDNEIPFFDHQIERWTRLEAYRMADKNIRERY
jgi:very-short-patch-repair endonuclease